MNEYFEPVNELPEYTFFTVKTKVHRELIEAFLKSEHTCIKVKLEFFNNDIRKASQSLSSFVHNHKYPIHVYRRNNQLFLEKIS